MKLRLFITLLAVIMLAGCNQQVDFNKTPPKQESDFSKQFISLFPEHDYESIEKKIDPTIKNDQLRSELKKIASFFPAEKPKDIQIVESFNFSNADVANTNITFQYEYPSKWLLVSINLQEKGSDISVVAIHVQPLEDSVENIGKFSFEGKSFLHYLFLAATIFVPLLILFSLILCIRTPIPERKWIWILYILIGVGKVSFNWFDGAINFNPLSFQILGAGFWKMGSVSPWILTVSIPVGAIMFLLRRKKWLNKPTDDQLIQPADEQKLAPEDSVK